MRLLFIVLIPVLAAVWGCAHTQQASVPVEYRAWADELRREFPFRAGMTTAEVSRLIRENNERAHAIMDEEFQRDREEGVFRPPAYADPERRLYLYVDFFDQMSKDYQDSLSFWVNGRHQFWVDMAIADGKVTNIYITPGNMSVMLPAFCFDGSGEHIGPFVKFQNQMTVP